MARSAHRLRSFGASLGALLALQSPPVAAQDGFWTDSNFAEGGVELRSDERVFTLFALMNMLGFDRDHASRTEPVPLLVMHPDRVHVRNALASFRRAWDPQFQPFFDAHPRPAGEYLHYTLALAPPPAFKPPDARDPTLPGLDGFAPLLQTFHDRALIAKLHESVRPRLRAQRMQMLPAVDALVGKVNGLLRVEPDDEAGEHRVVFIFNPLDAHDSVHDLRLGEARYIVAGPTLPERGSPVDWLARPLAENLIASWVKALDAEGPPAADGKALYDAVAAAEPEAARAHATWQALLVSLLGTEVHHRLGRKPPAPPAAGSLAARVQAAFDAYVAEGKAPMRAYLPRLLAALRADVTAGSADADERPRGKK